VGVGVGLGVTATSIGESIARASAACCGTTPLPSAFNCAERGMSTPVTQPSGRPIMNSTARGDSLWRPSMPGSVGAGASLPRRISHRWIAAA
jgi:hypothetical protein